MECNVKLNKKNIIKTIRPSIRGSTVKLRLRFLYITYDIFKGKFTLQYRSHFVLGPISYSYMRNIPICVIGLEIHGSDSMDVLIVSYIKIYLTEL